MANPSSLTQLKDIHLPSPISWWPLAPVWYLLITFSIFSLIIFIYYLHKKYTHTLAKKQALILLKQYQKNYETNPHVPLTSAQISELLRRVALAYYPREQVASLYGEEWVTFLNQTAKGVDFYSLKSLLLEAPFKAEEVMNLKPLFDAAQLWIKQRRTPCSN